MGSGSTSEITLLEKLKLQDESAFVQLYNLYVRKIYAYSLSILKSAELAEDVTQNTFIKLWEQRALIHTDRSIQAYLFTIAKNQALNIIKRASRETWISDEIAENAIHQSENGLEYTEHKQTKAFISQAINQLPPQRKLIYNLCHNLGYTYKQTAEKLGIKDSTVNSQMVKAIRTIKEFMLKNGALLLLLIHRNWYF